MERVDVRVVRSWPGVRVGQTLQLLVPRAKRLLAHGLVEKIPSKPQKKRARFSPKQESQSDDILT